MKKILTIVSVLGLLLSNNVSADIISSPSASMPEIVFPLAILVIIFLIVFIYFTTKKIKKDGDK